MVTGAGTARGAVPVTELISGQLGGYLQCEEVLLKLSTAPLSRLQGTERGGMNDIQFGGNGSEKGCEWLGL